MKKKSFIQKNGLIAVWSMAGFMAMGYIGFLATGSTDPNSAGTLVAQNTPTSSASVSPVQLEIAALRAHVAELTNREKSTSKKLSIIEEALGPNTASLPDQTAGFGVDQKVPTAKTVATLPQKANNVSINILPLTPEDKISELSGSDLSQSYGVDLASARSIASLKRHWKQLKKTNAAALKGLRPHFISKGTADLPLFLLVAGPFDRMSDARGHCKKLSKASIECQETAFQIEKNKFQTAGTSPSR